MPQPSRCGPVRPPRCIKPVKLNTTSVGTLALIPSNSHIFSSLNDGPPDQTLGCLFLNPSFLARLNAAPQLRFSLQWLVLFAAQPGHWLDYATATAQQDKNQIKGK